MTLSSCIDRSTGYNLVVFLWTFSKIGWLLIFSFCFFIQIFLFTIFSFQTIYEALLWVCDVLIFFLSIWLIQQIFLANIVSWCLLWIFYDVSDVFILYLSENSVLIQSFGLEFSNMLAFWIHNNFQVCKSGPPCL